MANAKDTMTRLSKLLGAFLLFGGVVAANTAWASGGDGGFSENAFAPEFHVPQADIPDYAGGNLGVVPPSFWRVYQFLAYRAISGHPLGKEEVRLLNISGWQVGEPGKKWDYDYDAKANGVEAWFAARRSIKSAAPMQARDYGGMNNYGEFIYGNAGDYGQYINCPANAFERAAQTLAERLKTGGEANAKLWLDGQDAVFRNCRPPVPWVNNKVENDSRIPVVKPPELPANAPSWLVYDREYQTAAAYFYAEKFDEARPAFQAIARNKKSPWQPTGDYLAARCLIRKAMLFYSFSGVNPSNVSSEYQDAIAARIKKRDELLSTARAELVSAAKSYPPAWELTGFVDAQLRPYERLQELGAALAANKIDAEAVRQLKDYFLLLDKTAGNKIREAADPMTAWIGLMQSQGNEFDYEPKNIEIRRKSVMELARKRMQESKDKTAWLVPLVTHARANELSVGERKAVAVLPESSPAYQTVQYQLARIAIAENKLDDGDEIVSRVLGRHQAGMSRANRNRWLALKVVTARTEAEFLRALPRSIAEMPGVPIPNETATNPPPAPLFDTDYTQHLYRDFALADLKALLASKNFTAQYASTGKMLKETMWTRAVLLGDFKTADELTDALMPGRDTTKHLYERFKNAKTADEKRLAAMLILVNAPELGLYGYEYSGGWGLAECPGGNNDACTPQPLNFMQPKAVEAARKEQAQLRKLSVAGYITPILLAWAKQKPDDPEAPKALHFYVSGKRAETKDARTAFQLLHKLYPKSEWAARTKYYY